MVNNTVNIILYLYSSTTIFCLEIVIKKKTNIDPCAAWKKKKHKKQKTNIIVQSLSPIPQKSLHIIYSIYCRFSLNIELVKAMFWKQPTIKTLAHCREIVSSESTCWVFKQEAVHLIFPPNAVSERTSVVVYRWKSSVCSPPLQEHEALVSNVIELSSLDGQRLQFNTMVTLSLSHSAPELRGYEVVIKRQINRETNEWKDVSGTKDLRCRQGIEMFSM